MGKMCETHPHHTPLQLSLPDRKTGRLAASDIHPTLGNLGSLAYQTKQLKGTFSSSLKPVDLGQSTLHKEILQKLSRSCPDFLRVCETLEGENLILQTPRMRKMLDDRQFSSTVELANVLMTDATFKFFRDAAIIFTSGYDMQLRRQA